MFGIGYGVGGWPVALFASGLYALHPVILLNGRRAMQEGALLCFGLLCIWLAMQIAHRLQDRQRVNTGWWIGLAFAAGLTLRWFDARQQTQWRGVCGSGLRLGVCSCPNGSIASMGDPADRP